MDVQANGPAPGIFPRRPHDQGAGNQHLHRTSGAGTVAPSAVFREVVEHWEGLFARMSKTASWKKYPEENLLEDGYLKGAELSKFFDELTKQMRVILQEAGAKVVR